MYALYIKTKKEEISQCIENKNVERTNLKLAIKELEEISPFLVSICNITITEFLAITSYKKLNGIKFNKENQYYDITFRRVKNYKTIIKKICELNEKLKQLKTHLITKKQYKSIIKTYNQFAVSQIIYKGVRFSFKKLGVFYIKRKLNKKFNRINWAESKKQKEEILKRGGTPYDKYKAPEGEKWLVKVIEDYSCWFTWSKYSCNIKNNKDYHFKPTKGNITNLQNFRKADPLNELIYEQ